MFISGSLCYSRVSFLFAVSISVRVYFVFFTEWGLILRMRKHPLNFVSHTVLQCLCSLRDTELHGKQTWVFLSKAGGWDFFFSHFRVVLGTLGPVRVLLLQLILWSMCVFVFPLNRRKIAAVDSANKDPYCEGPVHLNYYFARNAAVCIPFKSDG